MDERLPSSLRLQRRDKCRSRVRRDGDRGRGRRASVRTMRNGDGRGAGSVVGDGDLVLWRRLRVCGCRRGGVDVQVVRAWTGGVGGWCYDWVVRY